ncbi:hypothetical protein RHSIM_Rhsim05G0190600 [Rhododendron simsii]|uniref:Uncharacterized protein n=1 Tax=Rhododendron simsii TaxID=118357 RepID=A0A834H1L3_RHOSS|nr:hypothetical protein RHSIM_Rhsim05G0190600 [Rhododendron simsii]
MDLLVHYITVAEKKRASERERVTGEIAIVEELLLLWPKAKCNFFVWVDLPPCDCGRDELLQNIDQLERELEKSKAEERRQRGMFVATWVAIFCFMVLYLTK